MGPFGPSSRLTVVSPERSRLRAFRRLRDTFGRRNRGRSGGILRLHVLAVAQGSSDRVQAPGIAVFICVLKVHLCAQAYIGPTKSRDAVEIRVPDLRQMPQLPYH